MTAPELPPKGERLPPAGWYPDPESPGSGRARYWDGERWTDQYRRGLSGRNAKLIAGSSSFVLVAGAIVGALVADDREPMNGAETVGYAVGGILGPLLIVSIVRFLYVRLFAKDRYFWTPWVIVAAAAITWLGVLGNAAREEEDGIGGQLEQAREDCAGVVAFPPLESPFAYKEPGAALIRTITGQVPAEFAGHFEYSLIRGEAGDQGLITAAALGDSEEYDLFREGFGARFPPGSGSEMQLSTGVELLFGPSGKGTLVGVFDGGCRAYAVEAANEAQLREFAEAIGEATLAE